MKAIVLATALCLLSSAAFSIGRPHNVFAARKAMIERASTASKPPQPSVFEKITVQAQSGAENTQKALSLTERLVKFVLKMLD
ncbi:MAG: hypothetical protein ACK4GN_03710 [Runella sp.]